jgi:NADPH:quinone reductase
MNTYGAEREQTSAAQAAVLQQLDGIESIGWGEQSIPPPAADQALVRVYGAGVGPWDVAFVNGDFPGISVPFIPGQEIAGLVEAAGEEAGVQPGERVYASLFPAGGGFAQLAIASADRLAPMPEGVSFEDAASLVVAGGTAYEGLIDRGELHADETVLITAAAGGVGSIAVQLAAAVGARVVCAASASNHDYLRGLGASNVFDYHAADWIEMVLAAVPGGVDVLFDAAGGLTDNQAVAAVRTGGRVISVIPPFDALELERGITGHSFGATVNRERLEALRGFVDAGTLHPQLEADLPLEQARDGLRRVAGRHTRRKIVLRIPQARQERDAR